MRHKSGCANLIEALEPRRLLAEITLPELPGSMTYDHGRERLYFACPAGFIETYDIRSGLLLPQIAIGGYVAAAALTPDGSQLYVLGSDRSNANFIKRINVATGAITTNSFAGDDALLDVAIASNAKVFITSYSGMKEFNPGDGSLRVRNDAPAINAVRIDASDGHRTLLFTSNSEYGDPQGCVYDAAHDSFSRAIASQALLRGEPSAISGDGAVLCIGGELFS